MKRWPAVAALALLLAIARPALAGPPFVTDDAEPTDTGHWEIYNFAEAVVTPGDTAGAVGLDLNYGPVKDLQLTATLPLAFESGLGVGNVELAAKYRILHQVEGSWTPDLAVFPRVFLPAPDSRFGSDRAALLLPVWAQKDFGPWSVFGGGGYTLNPGRDSRNFWVSGLVVTRQINDRLQLGAEIYHQTPDARDAKAFTGLNGGMILKLTPHWSLLAAGGPGIENARSEGQYDVYAALEAQF